MKRRLRLGLLVLVGLLAALVVAALIAMYVVLQPARFTALLESRAQAAGLQLTLASPATPTLWPKPALELEGLTVRGNGTTTPLIVASRGKLVLPWRTLLGGETVVSRLEVEGARIDVDAVSAYLDTLPPRSSTASAMLPTIDAGFRIGRGTLLRGNRLLLSNVDIDAGRLVSGHRFTLSLAATTADETPYAIDLETTPILADGVLTFNDVSIDAASQPRFSSSLRGTATWRGGADVGASLAGSIQRADATPYDIVLGIAPANQNDPLYVTVKLDGESDHADLRIPPIALADWWAGIGHGESPTVPPLLGSVQAKSLDAGGVHVEGLRIRATPASAFTAPTAAPGGVP